MRFRHKLCCSSSMLIWITLSIFKKLCEHFKIIPPGTCFILHMGNNSFGNHTWEEINCKLHLCSFSHIIGSIDIELAVTLEKKLWQPRGALSIIPLWCIVLSGGSCSGVNGGRGGICYIDLWWHLCQWILFSCCLGLHCTRFWFSASYPPSSASSSSVSSVSFPPFGSAGSVTGSHCLVHPYWLW